MCINSRWKRPGNDFSERRWLASCLKFIPESVKEFTFAQVTRWYCCYRWQYVDALAVLEGE
jgi:hypothetical protein